MVLFDSPVILALWTYEQDCATGPFFCEIELVVVTALGRYYHRHRTHLGICRKVGVTRLDVELTVLVHRDFKSRSMVTTSCLIPEPRVWDRSLHAIGTSIDYTA